MEKVVVAMSGGVDSSVAAGLLKQGGYEVIGLFMRMGTPFGSSAEPRQRSCCSLEDAHDARRVAEALDMPFYVLNFQRDFEEIIDDFCREYARGRTPNPCILCNQRLKFGRLLRFARGLRAGHLATGHYARLGKANGRYILRKGLDPRKDQSYVLFSINQEQLSYALFPLGEMTKAEVREKARQMGLKTRDKPESQEICFVPEEGYGRFLLERTGGQVKPGLIKDTRGRVLGRHPGIEFFTIGQRRGLGLALGVPYYVVDIDPEGAVVVVGRDEELLEKEFVVTGLNWIAIEALDSERQAEVKIRYTHPASPAIIYPEGDGVRVVFRQPQKAITSGQAAVFYDGDVVLGGGWIDRRVSSRETYSEAKEPLEKEAIQR